MSLSPLELTCWSLRFKTAAVAGTARNGRPGKPDCGLSRNFTGPELRKLSGSPLGHSKVATDLRNRLAGIANACTCIPRCRGGTTLTLLKLATQSLSLARSHTTPHHSHNRSPRQHNTVPCTPGAHTTQPSCRPRTCALDFGRPSRPPCALGSWHAVRLWAGKRREPPHAPQHPAPAWDHKTCHIYRGRCVASYSTEATRGTTSKRRTLYTLNMHSFQVSDRQSEPGACISTVA